MPDGKKIDAQFSAQPPDCVIQPCPFAPVVTGLGADVDSLAAKSPTLENNLTTLKQDGWTIEYGAAGAGSYCDRDAKSIVIDSNSKGKTNDIVQTLAHESGHALYHPDPFVPAAGRTRQQYIVANTMSNLKDEGEVTMMNCQIRQEILTKLGPDIGVAGAQDLQYRAVYDKYPNEIDRDTARTEIGNLFADGEHPSTAPTGTYRQYYGDFHGQEFDKQGP